MKHLKNGKFLLGISLVLVGVALVLSWTSGKPAREITRQELSQLLQTKTLEGMVATPTPYAGIYHIEGTHKNGEGHREGVCNNSLPGASRTN